MYKRSVFCAFFFIVNHYNKASVIKDRTVRNGTTESVIERPENFDIHDGIHGNRRLPKQKYGRLIRQQRMKKLQYNYEKLDVFAAQGEENYYEPYSQDGQWVFTRPMNKDFLFKWTWHNSTQTTPRGNISDTAHRFCPLIYELYGRVCGRRLDSYHWKYQYKEFKNLCALQDENMRVKLNHWFPIHSNDCQDYTWNFPYQWSRGRDINWFVSSVSYYANGSPHTVPRSTFKLNKLVFG